MKFYYLYRLSWKNKYPFLLYLIPFIIGILTALFLKPQSSFWLLTLFLFSLITGIILHISKGAFYQPFRFLSLQFSLIFLGCISSYYNDIRHHDDWYGKYLSEAQALDVKITGNPELKEKTILLPVNVAGVFLGDTRKATKGEIKLYLYLNDSLPNFTIGSSLIIPNQLIVIQDNGNPYNFKYAAYLQRNNIFHQAFLSFEQLSYLPKERKSSFIASLRQRLFASIQNNISDSTTQSMVATMLLNDRTLLNNDLWLAYSVTGIAHIIAISGMHVSILFGVFFFILKWMRSKKWEWLKYFLAIPIVWIYVSMTNFPPSAVRAAVMFTLLALSVALNKKTENINILAIAAFALLIYNPNWLFDTGVQLSFSAVLSIFIFYKPILKLWKPKWKALSIFWNIIAVSLAAQILVFPLVIYYFHQFPVWVLIANIPATFYSLFLMVGSLFLFTFDALSIPCMWLGDCLGFMTKSFHHLIYYLAENTPSYLQQLHIDLIDFFILMLFISTLAIFAFHKKIIYLYSGLSLLSLLFISFILQDISALKQRRLVVYNISGNSSINYFLGKKHLSSNNLLSKKNYNYNILPSQLGYRAMKIELGYLPDFWEINGNKILYLPNSVKPKTDIQFPVDYLILDKTTEFNPHLWKEVFEAKQIILDGSLPRWKALKWRKELNEMGISVHWVQEDGAWVYGN